MAERPLPRGLTLRRAGPADVAAVAALTDAAYARWIPVLGRKPMPMLADYGRAVREHAIDLLCGEAGLAALVETVERADDLLVENLAVHPAHQGRGLGGTLLDHAVARAAARGTPTVRLYTNALMAANVAFYAARGFRVEREETRPVGRVVHMVRTPA